MQVGRAPSRHTLHIGGSGRVLVPSSINHVTPPPSSPLLYLLPRPDPSLIPLSTSLLQLSCCCALLNSSRPVALHCGIDLHGYYGRTCCLVGVCSTFVNVVAHALASLGWRPGSVLAPRLRLECQLFSCMHACASLGSVSDDWGVHGCCCIR